MAACPYCGLPLFGQADPLDPSSAEPVDPAERDTRLLPRMQNAIPEPGPEEGEGPGRPRAAKSLIVAAVAVGVVALAAVLIFAHPWNPNLYDTRAETPADTSMEGFPGTVERLTGQDSTGEATEELTGDEATFAAFTSVLEEQDALADELDQEMEDLEAAPSATEGSRGLSREQAQSTSLHISNLISEIEESDVSSGTYARAKEELVTMGNYLRNRADALTDAWVVVMASGASEEDMEAAVDAARATDASFSRLYRDARSGFELEDPEA